MRQPWDVTEEMFLSEDEVETLLEAVRRKAAEGHAADITDRVIVESLLFSGLRTSEFCHLTLGQTIVGQGESVFLIEPARKPKRVVFVPHLVSELIRDYAATVRPDLLPEDISASDLSRPLIFNDRRRPYERTGLYRRVVRILTAAGLGERASVQLLRHTYGYLAYKRSGGNLLFVQRQLGHAHPMVTSVYAQFVEEDYAALSEQVGSVSEFRRES